MLHSENPEVRRLLLNGNIGLEKESLRVNEEGFLAKTPHPFSKEDH
ncbi:MAG: glutamate--cysteine ligase, partial [Allobaculum sp.]|nr:glutamate--cysteine ligase [Allobaculum sp.]